MRKIKEQMLLLGLSPKKELINVLLVDLFLFLVAGVSYFLTKQIMYLASFVAMSLMLVSITMCFGALGQLDLMC